MGMEPWRVTRVSAMGFSFVWLGVGAECGESISNQYEDVDTCKTFYKKMSRATQITSNGDELL